MTIIKPATTDTDIAATFNVFQQLRVHLNDVDDFVQRVKTQQEQGYVLVALLDDAGEVRAIAGYRIWDNLETVEPRYHVHCRLVAQTANTRSKGYGEELWEYLEQTAKESGCARILLDSGTQRQRAHKFYLNRGMVIERLILKSICDYPQLLITLEM
eukprot:jgi/Botrbrau1/15702/Bobra.4_1s0075.1